jgi:hypothetical protein
MKDSSFSYYMHDGPTAFSIEVAGALAAEGAKKLEQDWLSASALIGNKELIVDLSFVSEIDQVGRQLLLRWRRNGATVVASTPESRALVESVTGRPLRPLARIAYTSKPYRSESFFSQRASDCCVAGTADSYERLSRGSCDCSAHTRVFPLGLVSSHLPC